MFTPKTMARAFYVLGGAYFIVGLLIEDADKRARKAAESETVTDDSVSG